MTSARPLTAIDIFAGAGGFTLAARDLEIDVRAAVESDVHACATYTRNFVRDKTPFPQLFREDICDVDWTEVLTSAQLKAGECSILMGGPPCQGFSTHRIKGAGIGDPRNHLLNSYFEALDAIRPAVFVVENVAGILWARHRHYLDNFLRSSARTGYTVIEPTVLNARDFGVPQNRKRVFIVGWREDLDLRLAWPPKSTYFAPDSDEVLLHNGNVFRTAASVFAKPLRPRDQNGVHINHSAELIEVFETTPRDGGSRHESNRMLPCHVGHDGHRDVYGRIRLAAPGPTMTTACINPSKGRFLHPIENHGITARHAARFQGFPENFVFEGGLFAAARQIGNAVPRQMGRRVLRVLKRALTNAQREKSDGK
jgi:DNA (cytosine-5)-methyltransferase 1